MRFFLGAILNFEDYPDLPEWVKEEISKMILEK